MTKVIFQDFPDPGIVKKKSRTSQEAWEPCIEKSLNLYYNYDNLLKLRPTTCKLQVTTLATRSQSQRTVQSIVSAH